MIIFGHGQGSDPQSYASLVTKWQDAGYTVVAPLAVDSLKHPDRAKFTQMTGFMARLEDLQALRADVAARYPGKPVFLAGHSYGSLFSLYGAGAAGPMGPVAGPPVAGTIALSSPGAIPGLITDATFAGVKGPLLVVTGDADIIPGLVPDWKAHRLPFDTSAAGGKMLLVFKGGNHNLPVDGSAKQRDAIARITIDFLDAGVGSAGGQLKLKAEKSSSLYTVERR